MSTYSKKTVGRSYQVVSDNGFVACLCDSEAMADRIATLLNGDMMASRYSFVFTNGEPTDALPVASTASVGTTVISKTECDK